MSDFKRWGLERGEIVGGDGGGKRRKLTSHIRTQCGHIVSDVSDVKSYIRT